MSNKWSQYSYEELEKMLESSSTIREWGRKMGYKSFSKEKAKTLFQKYPTLEEKSKKLSYRKDLTGQRFGRLIVESFSEEKTKEKQNGKRYWKCKCDCGETAFVSTTNLTKGLCKSCGCLQKEIAGSHTFIDLTGQTFGKLTVIKQGERPEGVNNTRAYWWCKCSCNNPELILVQGQLLRNGHKVSCGCIASQYEEKAMKILRENNINYKTQFTFDDLLGSTGIPLRFDFAIFDKKNNLSHLIEIQGQQHFKIVPSWGGKEKFEQQQKYDQMKRDYCKKNNIKLIEIPYNKEISIKTMQLDKII